MFNRSRLFLAAIASALSLDLSKAADVVKASKVVVNPHFHGHFQKARRAMRQTNWKGVKHANPANFSGIEGEIVQAAADKRVRKACLRSHHMTSVYS